MSTLYFEDFEIDYDDIYEPNYMTTEYQKNIYHVFMCFILLLLFTYSWYVRYFHNCKEALDYSEYYNVIEYDVDKDEIKNAFDNYIEVLKIRRFFNKIENKVKLFSIYDNEPMIISIHKLLTEYNDNMFVDTLKYTRYYNQSFKVPTDYISINIKELYDEEQAIFIDKNLFDITNNKGYYKIYNNVSDKYIYTNFAKLNVYRWIIELGIYDILYDSLC